MPTISDLFALDPLKLTRDDIDQMIDYYINARGQFRAGGTTAQAKKLEKIDLNTLLGQKIGG